LKPAAVGIEWSKDRPLHFLPTTSTTAIDRDAASGKFRQQLCGTGGDLSISGHQDCPFQVFAKLLGANLPSIQSVRRRSADSNDGPMASEGQCGRIVGPGAAQDEVIVSVDQNADHDSLE
jgi:hypothetical protein